MWRDCLRRQFGCLNLGLTIHSVHLQHIPQGREENEQQTNLLEADWDEVKRTFDRFPAKDVTVLVVFRKLEEEENL